VGTLAAIHAIISPKDLKTHLSGQGATLRFVFKLFKEPWFSHKCFIQCFIQDIVLSPWDSSLFWVYFSDGSYDFSLPRAWCDQVEDVMLGIPEADEVSIYEVVVLLTDEDDEASTDEDDEASTDEDDEASTDEDDEASTDDGGEALTDEDDEASTDDGDEALTDEDDEALTDEGDEAWTDEDDEAWTDEDDEAWTDEADEVASIDESESSAES